MQRKSKILVIDGHAVFRDLQSFLLARSGQVITAANASQALEIARIELPDVVVADMQLPDMGGDALCKEIRADARLQDTPVILILGRDAGEDRERAVRAGADDILTKPLDQRSLVLSVNRFLRTPVVRAFPRAPLEGAVSVRVGEENVEATARNISRAGIHLDLDRNLAPGTEVHLAFQLPEICSALSATAKAVWDVPGEASGRYGVGLRFLSLDRNSAQQIEEYVNERIPSNNPPGFPIS